MDYEKAISELAKEHPCFKNTLQEKFPNVFLKYDENLTYLYEGIGRIYKLHRVDGRYAWIDLLSSNCYADGTYSTAEIALSNHKFIVCKNKNEF